MTKTTATTSSPGGKNNTQIRRDPADKAREALGVATRKHQRIKDAIATHEAALRDLRTEQEQLLAEVRYLAAHPALQGATVSTDSTGRTHTEETSAS